MKTKVFNGARCAMFFVLVLSSLLTVTSCSKDDKEDKHPLIGWWHRYEKNLEYKLEFREDGKGQMRYYDRSSEDFMYYISGSGIYGKMTYTSGNYVFRKELDWSYRIENGTLFLLDNSDPFGHYVEWQRLQ